MTQHPLYPIIKTLAQESIPYGSIITVKDVIERIEGKALPPQEGDAIEETAKTSAYVAYNRQIGIEMSGAEILAYLEEHEDAIRREVGAPVWKTEITVVDLEDE